MNNDALLDIRNAVLAVTGLALILWAAEPVAAAEKTAPAAAVATPKPAEAARTPEAPPVATATAVEPPQEAPMEAEPYPPEPGPLLVGDATEDLLAWQRSGVIASPTPRPITGQVANRNYERYLKSFEHPIPESLTSTVKAGSGGGSGK